MAIVLLAGIGGCGAEEPTVFGPVVAGQFYTDDPAALADQIQGFLEAAEPPKPKTDVLGYIVPHAGYIYSGPVAAYAYDLLGLEKTKLAVVMAPSHYVHSEKVGVLDVDRYRTPLGEIPVARDAISKLMKEDQNLFTKDLSLFEREHSLEVQLPFLQESLKDFRIVPLVIGMPSRPIAARLARVLSRTLGDDDVVYLASSDMSHHYPYDTAVEMDRLALKRIAGMDMDGLTDDIRRDRSQLCGLGPVLTLMELAALRGYCHVHELEYANSGDTAGPKNSVVGYCAVAFAAAGGLGEAEREELIRLARSSMESYLTDRKVPSYEPESEALRAWGAAFVTLKKGGRLRGCIGHVTARMPLFKSVQEMAVAAAVHDPRFPPVSADELEEIEIEISVMSPLRTVYDPRDVKVGRDGLVVRKGGRSGLLLPQVPVERGWSREQFLGQTCVKADLPEDAWKSGAEIYAFSAEVFAEESRD